MGHAELYVPTDPMHAIRTALATVSSRSVYGLTADAYLSPAAMHLTHQNAVFSAGSEIAGLSRQWRHSCIFCRQQRPSCLCLD